MRLIDADICLIEAWQNFYKQEEEHEKNIDDYDIMRDQFYEQSGFECCQQTIVNTPTVEAIPIPKDATNGDILRTIFPKAKHELQKFYKEDTIVFDLDGFYMRISSDWWNSPYKENIEDGNVD